MLPGSNTVSRGAGASSGAVRGRLDLMVALSHRTELVLPDHICCDDPVNSHRIWAALWYVAENWSMPKSPAIDEPALSCVFYEPAPATCSEGTAL
jgi:hypothetical protein